MVLYKFAPVRWAAHADLDLGVIPPIGSHIISVLIPLGAGGSLFALGFLFNPGPILFPIPPLESTLFVEHRKYPCIQGHIPLGCIFNDEQE
jgi:hypothetical protein